MSTARRRASHTIAVVQPGLRPFFLSDQHGLIARIFSAFLSFFHTQAAVKTTDRIAVAASEMTRSSDGREGPRRADFFFLHALCPAHAPTTGTGSRMRRAGDADSCPKRPVWAFVRSLLFSVSCVPLSCENTHKHTHLHHSTHHHDRTGHLLLVIGTERHQGFLVEKKGPSSRKEHAVLRTRMVVGAPRFFWKAGIGRGGGRDTCMRMGRPAARLYK